MNKILDDMKSMNRAVKPYVYFLWELTYESNAQNVLELGSRQLQSGRTFLSALEEKKSGLLTAVDLADRSSRAPDFLLPYLRMIVGNTHNQETFNKVNDRQYDILFIDAGHNYEDVSMDYKMYGELVKSGGYIIFHDSHNPNETCSKFWKELPDNNKLELDYGFAGLGILRKI